MKKIAKLLEVDEVHLFDTKGFIYAGTNPEYYGFNFDSGEQMNFFKPMLSDHDLSLCQDVTPNTAEGKLMMYALVWREDKKGLVQIGLTPTRLLGQIERNRVSDILLEIPTNDNIYFVVNHSTGIIVECTMKDYQGGTLQEAGINDDIFSEDEFSHFQTKIDNEGYLSDFRICGNYEIGVCQAKKDVYRETYLGSLIVLVYLLFASAVIVFIVNYMTQKEWEKEKKHQEEMKKALVQANAASEAKSVFLANMSHDIRTPMNAIIGFTDLLGKHINEVEKRDNYMAKIKSSGKYLLELLNNVLEMARIESGQTVVDENVWSIEQFHHTLLAIFKEEIDRKELTFHWDVEVEHPCVWCDSTKVQEIFFNLVSNAVKYTPGGGTVSLRLHEYPSDREGYIVYKTEVEDTGIGMSKEFLPHIFDEFTRERNTTQSKIGGTGLGMPIAKKLVDLLGGTITVESEVGRGTKFTVTLPFQAADKDKDKESEENSDDVLAEIVANEFAGKRLLLAEDNDLNAEIATEILEEFGLAVERAKDGVVCIDMMKNAEPGYYDLVLMDIQMPNMDGYEAAKRIREFPGPKKDIPIIAMTANAFKEDKQRAFSVGMNGHIAKPMDVIKLIKELRRFMLC